MPGCIVTARHSLPALSPDPVTVGAAAVSFLVDPPFWLTFPPETGPLRTGIFHL